MADKAIKVVLSADVRNYVQGMREAAEATADVNRGAENIDEWGAQWGEAASQVGGQMLVLGAAITTGLGLTAKAAIDWESAWTGVLKTVDGTPEELANVEAGLRDLATVLPASHAEIAAVAEAAGQLGVATPNVVEFTRTMIDLGETTNLSAEQAAMSLAQFMNVMRTGQDQASNLGSALVGLGNNFATTEADILAMAQRLAGAGVQVGLSEGEVLGLATALSSVGIEAEAGGSAMSKVMIDIAASVDEGGDRVAKFAQVAGMSAASFAEKWKTEPGAALAAFVQGLADAESQGTSTLGILADLGITEVRMRDALLGAAAAADTFTGAMAMGNEAFAENVALAEEAELRYGTTESKLGILRNRFTEAGIELGRALLPAVEGIVDGLGAFADMLTDISAGPMGGFITGTGAIVGGLLLVGGAALTIIPQIAQTGAALATLGLTADVVRAKTALLWTTMSNPIVLAALAAGALAVGAAMTIQARETERVEASLRLLRAEMGKGANATETLALAAESVQHGFGGSEKAIANTASQLERLPELLDRLQAQDESFNLGVEIDLDTNWGHATKALRLYGDELASLAGAGNMATVSASLRELADAHSLTNEQMWQLIDESPKLRDQLHELALGADAPVGALSSLEEQTALVEWAMQDTGEAGGVFADALSDAETAAADAARATQDLIDSIRGLDDLLSAHLHAEIGYWEALEGVNGALEKNGATLDMSTQAGRENMLALDELASSTNDYAAQVLETTGSQAAAAVVLEEGRQAYIDARIAMGDSAEMAAYLADELFGIPGTVLTEVTDAGTIDATTLSVDELDKKINGLPPNTRVEVTGLTQEAQEQLELLGHTVINLPNGTVHVTTSGVDAAAAAIDRAAEDRWSTIHVNTVLNTQSGTRPRMQLNHDGGILEFMARGGLRPMSPLAQMVPPSTWRVVGDRGDVDEAYIPLDGSARSVAILMEAIRRMPGFAMADGGIAAAAVAAARHQSAQSVQVSFDRRLGTTNNNTFHLAGDSGSGFAHAVVAELEWNAKVRR